MIRSFSLKFTIVLSFCFDYGLSQPITKCKTFSGPKPNEPCVFPFDYKGFTHFDCITVEHDQLWCSTEVNANGSHVDGNWGNCGDECFSGNLDSLYCYFTDKNILDDSY